MAADLVSVKPPAIVWGGIGFGERGQSGLVEPNRTQTLHTGQHISRSHPNSAPGKTASH